MNILFGLALVLVLMLGESSIASPVIASDESRVALLLLVMSIPPLFAGAQVFLFHYRFANCSNLELQQRVLTRNVIWHFLVWLAASLAIVGILQWQFTVRTSWQLDRLPALDELIILAPSLVSLIVSWLIEFESQSCRIEHDVIASARADYVSIRCRVYLAVAIIPLLLLLLIRDCWFLLETVPIYGFLAILFLFLVAMLVVMPLVIGKLWGSRSLSPEEGRERLLRQCDSQLMGIREILVWDTGRSVVNALVAGVFPRWRILMVSDLLLASFPAAEIDAILRHEAGHLRLAHLPIRLVFILVPAMALVAMDLDPNQTTAIFLCKWIEYLHLPLSPTLVTAGLFLAYLLIATVWLSRNMEYEADLYAAGLLPQSSQFPSSEAAPQLIAALHRFADGNPSQTRASSLTHPSLQSRLDWVNRCLADPQMATGFRRLFHLQQLAIAGAILVLTILVLAC